MKKKLEFSILIFRLKMLKQTFNMKEYDRSLNFDIDDETVIESLDEHGLGELIELEESRHGLLLDFTGMILFQDDVSFFFQLLSPQDDYSERVFDSYFSISKVDFNRLLKTDKIKIIRIQ
ncbi:hypothetical protein [Enterococcus casseliflavus]|jgi:hypothetical protein|uniref:hypothetical protein n=1 Tax=Enterococcus casseliflavus TaxID=37734 RepID=UPI001883DA3F|nr:hypothetical protein [Enterococcus casseliflavus]MBE9908837.1 hypothetical protein [Enterococcus casseliflavus]MEB6088093.1 hypothetical protein [Enterococcus casseliflavus]